MATDHGAIGKHIKSKKIQRTKVGVHVISIFLGVHVAHLEGPNYLGAFMNSIHVTSVFLFFFANSQSGWIT